MNYSEQMLASLRNRVSSFMKEKRFLHTLGVEKAARILGEYLIPEYVSELRAAALLHDITKEMPTDEQVKILRDNKFDLTEEDLSTPKILHSFSAPFFIKENFSEFYTKNIASSIKNHTVGCENMSVFDKIIFISDYVEENREYSSCIELRNMLFSDIDKLSRNDLLKRLDEVCLLSLEGALKNLTDQGITINSRMLKTENDFKSKSYHN